ncbi:hypothetical protein IWQ61_008687 [Dispira simplex]|nr:hypothetical protein IWQ61_008687 [Dispira simplex]
MFNFPVPKFVIAIRRRPICIMVVVGLAIFTDMLMYGLAIPVLPHLLEDQVDNISLANGVLSGCYAAGLLVGAPLSGYLSDKFRNRQIPMCVGLIVLLVATLLFGISTAYWQLILARICQGAASGASWAIGFSMVADVYPPEKAGVAMGTIMGCNTLGHLAGPTVGGLLYEAGDRHTPFIFGACLAFVDLVARLLIGETIEWKRLYMKGPDGVSEYEEPPLTHMSMMKMVRSWRVLAVCLASFGVAAIISGIDPILPLYLQSKFHLSTGLVGVVFIAIVLPNVIASPLIGWALDRFQPNRLLIVSLGLVLIGATGLPIAVPDELGLHIFTLVLLGITVSVGISPVTPELLYFMHEKGCNSYGTVYALFNVAFSIGMFVGPVISGALYDVAGFFNTMLYMSVLMFFLALLILSVEGVKIYRRRQASRAMQLEKGQETPSPSANLLVSSPDKQSFEER